MSTPRRRWCPSCRALFGGALVRCPRDAVELVDDEGDRLIGGVVGEGFAIDALVEETAMGRRYRAHRDGDARRFAVTVMYGELARDIKVVARFARAAEEAAHDGLIDCGECDGLLYVAVEWREDVRKSDELVRDSDNPIRAAVAALRAQALAAPTTTVALVPRRRWRFAALATLFAVVTGLAAFEVAGAARRRAEAAAELSPR